MLRTGSIATGSGEIFYAYDEEGVWAVSAPGRPRTEWQARLERKGLDLTASLPDDCDSLGLARQLLEYMAGLRQSFDLPLHLMGTPFQLRVWSALRSIPYGEVRSYQDIAREIGSPRAARAVGQANNRNPLAIIIPCHRVVASGGGLGGYAGGLSSKEHLLALEQRYRA